MGRLEGTRGRASERELEIGNDGVVAWQPASPELLIRQQRGSLRPSQDAFRHERVRGVRLRPYCSPEEIKHRSDQLQLQERDDIWRANGPAGRV
jgi:hypothetical protein